MVNSNLKNQRRLLFSNATDAASRTLSDFTIDLVFIGVLGASVLDMGLLNTLGSIAFIVASIPIGHLVDTYKPLRTLRVGLSAKLVLMSCLLLTTFTGLLSIPLGFLLCTLMGICNVLAETSQVAIVPILNETERSERAPSISKLIARLTAADQSLGIIIPAVAGTGFLLFGAPALLTLALTLGLIALSFSIAIRRHPATEPEMQNEALAEAKEAAPDEKRILAGLHYLRKNRGLLANTLVVACSNLGLAITGAVEAVFIIKYLNLGAVWFGALASIGAVGGLLGASIATKFIARFRLGQLTIGAVSFQILLSGLMLIAAFTTPAVSVALLIVHGFFWGIVVIILNISTSSWMATATPEKLLGRVSSARRLFTFGAIPLGSLLGGYIGTDGRIPAALATATLFIVVGLLGYLWFNARETDPEPTN